MHSVDMIFDHMPKAMPLYLRGMAGHRRGIRHGEKLPGIKARVKSFRIDQSHLRKVAGILSFGSGSTMPLIYPLTFLFPLHMSLITHRDFPFLYLAMLHTRDHVLQHRQVGLDEHLEITCVIASQRILTKGLEFDLHTVIRSDEAPVWEGISTNYFPGYFGAPDDFSPRIPAEPLAGDHSGIKWTMPARGKLRLGFLTGDYNGIHYSAPYARIMGFRSDFAHGQRSLAECLFRLPPLQENLPIRLDVALKGPVYYGRSVVMRYMTDHGDRRFDLYSGDNPKPCLMGSLYNVEPGSFLFDEQERMAP